MSVAKRVAVALSSLILIIIGFIIIFEYNSFSDDEPTVFAQDIKYPTEVTSKFPKGSNIADGWSLSLSMFDDGIRATGTGVTFNRVSKYDKKTITYTVSYEKTADSIRGYEPGEAVIVVDRYPLSKVARGINGPQSGFKEEIAADPVDSQVKSRDWSYEIIGDYYVFYNNFAISSSDTVSGSFDIVLTAGYIYESSSWSESDIPDGASFDTCATINGCCRTNSFSFANYSSVKNYTASADRNTPGYNIKMEPSNWLYIRYTLQFSEDNGVRPLLNHKITRTPIAGTKVYDSAMNEQIPDADGRYVFTNSSSRSGRYEYDIIIAYPKAQYENQVVKESFSLYGQYSRCALQYYYLDGENISSIDYSMASQCNTSVDLRQFGFISTGVDVGIDKGTTQWTSYKDGGQHIDYSCITTTGPSAIAEWTIKAIATGVPADGVVRIGDDMMLCKRVDGGYDFMNDSEYHITKISLPHYFIDTNGGRYSSSLTSELYVRYAGESQYVLYNTNRWWREIIFDRDDIVGAYVDVHGLTNGLSFDSDNSFSEFSINTDVHTSNIENNSNVYNIGYIEVLTGNGEVISEASENNYDTGALNFGIAQKDIETYGRYLCRDLSYVLVKDTKTLLRSSTTMSAFVQDNENQRFTSVVKSTSSATSFGTQSLPHKLEKMSIAVALAPGLISYGSVSINGFDSSSFKIRTVSGKEISPTDGTDYLLSHSTIEKRYSSDKKQEVVEVHFDFSDDPIDTTDAMRASAIYFSHFLLGISIPVEVDYTSYEEFGTRYQASSYIYRGDTDAYGNADTYDRDFDGDIDEIIGDSSSDSKSITAAMSYQRGIVGHVMTDVAGFSSSPHRVSSNANYSYKTILRTSTSPMTDIVVYNSIENAASSTEKWQGKLMSIDTTPALQKEWVDEIQVFWSPNEDPSTLDSDSSWKPVVGTTNLSKVKTVAFKFMKDGEPATMPENSTCYILLNMKAPSEEQVSSAYNSFSVEWTQIDSLTGKPSIKLPMTSNVTQVFMTANVPSPSYPITLKVINGEGGFSANGDISYTIDGRESEAEDTIQVQEHESVNIAYRSSEQYQLYSIQIDGEFVLLDGLENSITLDNITSSHNIIVTYKSKITLPETGQFGAVLFTTIAGFVLLICTAFLYIKKRYDN